MINLNVSEDFRFRVYLIICADFDATTDIYVWNQIEIPTKVILLTHISTITAQINGDIINALYN